MLAVFLQAFLKIKRKPWCLPCQWVTLKVGPTQRLHSQCAKMTHTFVNPSVFVSIWLGRDGARKQNMKAN